MKQLVKSLFFVSVFVICVGGCSSVADQKGSTAEDRTETEKAADTEEKIKGNADSSEKGSYPTRDIQWLIPYPAGSAMDLPTRVFQPYFESELKGKTIATNMPGSAGAVAAMELMNSKADGYTISSAQPSLLIPYILGSVDFYYHDFEVICQYGVINHGLVVRADSPYETLEDFLTASKENPDKLAVGASFNHVQQMAALELKTLSDAKYRVVEIGGTAIKAPELLSGRVDAYVDAFSACATYINSGEFRCLAVFADQRDPFFPDIPTAKECGYDASYDFSLGMMVPKGTPMDVVARLEAAAKAACENPGYKEGLSKMYANPTFIGRDDYIEELGQIKERLQITLEQLLKE